MHGRPPPPHGAMNCEHARGRSIYGSGLSLNSRRVVSRSRSSICKVKTRSCGAPVMLRRIDAKLDRISDDMRDLKVRATATEEAIAGVNRRLDRNARRAHRKAA